MRLELKVPALFSNYESGERFWKVWWSNTVENKSFRFMSRKNKDGTFKMVAVEAWGPSEKWNEKDVSWKIADTDQDISRHAESFMAGMKESHPKVVFTLADFSDCDTFEKFLKRWDEYGFNYGII